MSLNPHKPPMYINEESLSQNRPISLVQVMSEQLAAKVAMEDCITSSSLRVPLLHDTNMIQDPVVTCEQCYSSATGDHSVDEHYYWDSPSTTTEQQDDLVLALLLQQQEYDRFQINSYNTKLSTSPNEKVLAVPYSDSYEYLFRDEPQRSCREPLEEPDDEFVTNKQSHKVGNRLGDSRYQKKVREKKEKKSQTDMKTPTFEGIDGFSRKILFGLQSNQDILSKINGCIAQGKEAVIHHAVGGNNADVVFGADYAVKIYKTTKVEFRDRENYIEGEWRFRDYQTVRNNPRKIIKLWAEKELRNMKRLRANNIPCPDPILVRKHILVMSFIGKDGYPADQLGKAQLTPSSTSDMYWRCATQMRDLYHCAGLVHADLSPYNMLVYEDQLYFIDLAQAVTKEHAHAPEFLRRDCYNMTKFFRSRNIKTLTTRGLFEFVTSNNIPNKKELLNAYIENLRNTQTMGALTREQLIEEQVWLKISLPTTLKDVKVDRLLQEGVYFSSFKDMTIDGHGHEYEHE